MSAIDLFVVLGSTGEYSDRSEWMVAAYADKAMAEQHAALASEEARIAYATAENSDSPWEARNAFCNPYDPDASRMDYTGTTYYVSPAPLLARIPDVRTGAAT